MDLQDRLRTSLYTIFIPLETDTSEWMLVHGYTGAIDIVNNKIAQFLRQGGIVPNAEDVSAHFPITKTSINKLQKRGYLTAKTPFEEKEWVKTLANHLHSKSKRNGSSFIFMVAYDCNFRCPYCFENGISNNGKGWSKKTFTKDSVDRAYQAMLEIEPDAGKVNKQITLYGGEPLLAKNIGIVDYIVKKGVDLGYSFFAISNGYELEHYKDLLNPKMIKSLQITIDGPKEIHDTRRTHFEDGSSYDKIIENIKLCLAQEVRISVRINTEVKNFEYLQILNEDFKKHGLFDSKYFSVYSALIHGEDEISCNVVMSGKQGEERAAKYSNAFGILEVPEKPEYSPDDQYINFENEESRILESIVFHDDNEDEVEERMRTMNRSEYIKKFKEVLSKDPKMKISCQDYGLEARIMHVLKGGAFMNFQSTFCGAQNGMYILDPCGDIYSCWELVGQDEFIIGNYKDEIVFNQEALEKWQGKNISKVDACSKCKYAFFCGGGCMAGALKEGRGYNSSHCDGFPKMFQEFVPGTYFKFLEKKELEKQGPIEEETASIQVI